MNPELELIIKLGYRLVKRYYSINDLLYISIYIEIDETTTKRLTKAISLILLKGALVDIVKLEEDEMLKTLVKEL